MFRLITIKVRPSHMPHARARHPPPRLPPRLGPEPMPPRFPTASAPVGSMRPATAPARAPSILDSPSPFRSMDTAQAGAHRNFRRLPQAHGCDGRDRWTQVLDAHVLAVRDHTNAMVKAMHSILAKRRHRRPLLTFNLIRGGCVRRRRPHGRHRRPHGRLTRSHDRPSGGFAKTPWAVQRNVRMNKESGAAVAERRDGRAHRHL